MYLFLTLIIYQLYFTILDLLLNIRILRLFPVLITYFVSQYFSGRYRTIPKYRPQ